MLTIKGVARGIGKLLLAVVLLYGLSTLLLFGPVLFHDEEQLIEGSMDELLSLISIDHNEVVVKEAYSAPPNWAGDYSRGFCVQAAKPAEPDRVFSPGDLMDDDVQALLQDYGKIAKYEMPWLASPDELMTEDYLVGLIRSDVSSAHFAYVHPTLHDACYFAIKF